jgi:antibiotic biosynthesis monooxygenase (ABM) superfamily enzyme
MNLVVRSSLLAVSLHRSLVSSFVIPTTTSSPLANPWIRGMSSSLNAKPFAVIVQAEIQPDRMDEFLQLMEENATNTRKEPGCIRFGTS